MEGHSQATVVLFPCSLHKQEFKEATMRITSWAISLCVWLILAPPSIAREGEYCTERSHMGWLGWRSYELTRVAHMWADGAGSDTGWAGYSHTSWVLLGLTTFRWICMYSYCIYMTIWPSQIVQFSMMQSVVQQHIDSNWLRTSHHMYFGSTWCYHRDTIICIW